MARYIRVETSRGDLVYQYDDLSVCTVADSGALLLESKDGAGLTLAPAEWSRIHVAPRSDGVSE